MGGVTGTGTGGRLALSGLGMAFPRSQGQQALPTFVPMALLLLTPGQVRILSGGKAVDQQARPEPVGTCAHMFSCALLM